MNSLKSLNVILLRFVSIRLRDLDGRHGRIAVTCTFLHSWSPRLLWSKQTPVPRTFPEATDEKERHRGEGRQADQYSDRIHPAREYVLAITRHLVRTYLIHEHHQTSDRREHSPTEPPISAEQKAEPHLHFSYVTQEFVAPVTPAYHADLGNADQ